MIRTCNAQDVRHDMGLPTCGATYDDVDHSTACPHEYLPTREEIFEQLRANLEQAREAPCTCGECPTPEQIEALIELYEWAEAGEKS